MTEPEQNVEKLRAIYQKTSRSIKELLEASNIYELEMQKRSAQDKRDKPSKLLKTIVISLPILQQRRFD